MVKDDYVTVSDAAEIIGCTTARVRQLLQSGELAGEKVSERLWLIDRKKVSSYAKAQKNTGRPRGR